jgi:DNA polymerase kappa
MPNDHDVHDEYVTERDLQDVESSGMQHDSSLLNLRSPSSPMTTESEKPFSACTSTSDSKPGSSVKASNASAITVPGALENEPLTTHTCPICSKVMTTDNQGLNAHIDFCLSKGAIREAQAAASGSNSRKLKPSTNTLHTWTKRAKGRK